MGDSPMLVVDLQVCGPKEHVEQPETDDKAWTYFFPFSAFFNYLKHLIDQIISQ